MDLHDNLGIEDVTAITQGIGNVAASIRNKAKAKKAQKISDAGGYLTLTAFQKSLIPIPDYISKLNVTPSEAQKSDPIPATAGQIGEKVKSYLPWIIGIVVVVVVVIFIVKRK